MKKRILIIVLLIFSLTSCNIITPHPEQSLGTATDSNNEKVEIFKCHPTTEVYDFTNSSNYVSFKNDTYNYYIFRVGKIWDVALEDGEKHSYQGVETTLKFTVSQKDFHSIKSSAEETVTNSSSRNYEVTESVNYKRTTNSSFSNDAGIYGKSSHGSSSSIEIGLSATQAWGFSDQKTLSSTYEEVASSETTTTYEEIYTLSSDSPIGNYLYILIGNVDVYNAVVVNKDTNEFEIYTFTSVSSANRRLIYIGEDYKYPTESDVDLHFDINDVANIIQEEPTNDISNLILDVSTITIDLTPKDCQDKSNYNINSPINNTVAKNEIDPDIVDLQLFGCSIDKNGKYIIVNQKGFGVGLKFLQDADNIALTHCEGSDVFEAYINTDTDGGKIIGTNIDKAAEKGAYWIKVHYKSGKTEDGYFVTDFMNGKKKNDTIDILENFTYSQGDVSEITKIEIVIVYEIAAKYSGFLGIAGYTTTNWRYDYILEFAN